MSFCGELWPTGLVLATPDVGDNQREKVALTISINKKTVLYNKEESDNSKEKIKKYNQAES